MKYIIRRTSKYLNEVPCEGVTAENVERWEYRTASKEEMAKILPSEDYSKYENIEKDGNTWCRFKTKELVFVMNIDDIYAFCEKLGENVIVIPKGDEYPYPIIEIYDTYRE